MDAQEDRTIPPLSDQSLWLSKKGRSWVFLRMEPLKGDFSSTSTPRYRITSFVGGLPTLFRDRLTIVLERVCLIFSEIGILFFSFRFAGI